MEKGSKVPEFFFAVDRAGKKDDGRITSEYPAWYHKRRVRNFKREIEDDERRQEWFPVARDMESKRREEETIRMKKENLAQQEMKPDISSIKDPLHRMRQKFAKIIIEDIHHPRTDMMKGLANPHDILDRLNEHWIGEGTGINNRGVEGAVMQKMNIFHKSGKFRGKDIIKAYRMISVLLDEDPSDERLRRDHAYGTYQEDVPYERLVKESGG